MSAGFNSAGSLVTAFPVPVNRQIGETMYVGQLAQSGLVGKAGGHVQIADAATEADEDNHELLGIVTGAFEDGVYNGTYYGDGVTYDTTLANVLANTHKDAAMVQIIEIIPNITLIKAPLYNAAYGSALQVLTETTGDATGLTVTHSGETLSDALDSFATIYCRTGANRGRYRIVTNCGTGAQVCTVAFPYAIATGDTFVRASCVLGVGGMNIPATANCIDGDNALTYYYLVKYHSINLEESGKEFAVFSVLSNSDAPA